MWDALTRFSTPPEVYALNAPLVIIPDNGVVAGLEVELDFVTRDERGRRRPKTLNHQGGQAYPLDRAFPQAATSYSQSRLDLAENLLLRRRS